MDSFSVSDDGKHSAQLTFKKPMGFVKKTRTQVASNAFSQAVGIAGVGLGAIAGASASPAIKKLKKKGSHSALPHALQPQRLHDPSALS